MKQLTYTSEQQLINDAAQMLIESHLSWSGSLEEMPSRDIDCTYSSVLIAVLKHEYTPEEWEKASDEEKHLAEAQAHYLYKRAKQLADEKWRAALFLLGL